MSYEVWGDPPDEEPVICEMCEEELCSSADCALCQATTRADNAESALYRFKHMLAHRLRIMRSRKVYEDGKFANGISVEMLMAQTLLYSIPGVLFPHEVSPAQMVAEAEKALLTFENAHCWYSTQTGCNCLHNNKPLPAIHDATCPYRILFAGAYEVKEPQ